MKPFRRRLGRFTAAFEPDEASIIASLADQVRSQLATRRSTGSADPLIGITGMVMGGTDKPDDPVLARLLPDFHADDAVLSAGLRVLREPELIAAKDAAAVTLIDSVPRGGGVVWLDEQTASSWLAALNDIRLALAVRLDITDDGPPPSVAEDRHQAQSYAVYRWLSVVQESLVEAMMG